MIGPTDLFHPSPALHFKIFPGVSDLLHEASKFQHHIKLCSSINHIQKYINNQQIFSATCFGPPKHVAENIVSEIHHKYGSVFVGYLYIFGYTSLV